MVVNAGGRMNTFCLIHWKDTLCIFMCAFRNVHNMILNILGMEHPFYIQDIEVSTSRMLSELKIWIP